MITVIDPTECPLDDTLSCDRCTYCAPVGWGVDTGLSFYPGSSRPGETLCDLCAEWGVEVSRSRWENSHYR